MKLNLLCKVCNSTVIYLLDGVSYAYDDQEAHMIYHIAPLIASGKYKYFVAVCEDHLKFYHGNSYEFNIEKINRYLFARVLE